MGFKRAQWHSGLTYHQTCENCKNEMYYMDNSLGFRAWFPDGFVYCTRCKKPLRHHERFAIDAASYSQPPQYAPDASSQMSDQMPLSQPVGQRFCTACGKQARPEDRFCSGCGTMLTN